MSTQTTPVMEMFEHLFEKAEAKAAAKGTFVTLMVAPIPVVHDYIQATRVRDGLPPHPVGADVLPVALYNRLNAVVFGVQTVETHAYHGVLSCWDSDQIRPEIGECPALNGTPRPDETTHEFEHILWGCEVEDWMAGCHPVIATLLNSKTEQPLVTAKLIP